MLCFVEGGALTSGIHSWSCGLQGWSFAAAMALSGAQAGAADPLCLPHVLFLKEGTTLPHSYRAIYDNPATRPQQSTSH